MLAYLMFNLIHGIVLIFPRRISYWIGSRVADLNYLFKVKTRMAVNANIRHVLSVGLGSDNISESVVRANTRAVFRNFAKYLVDFFSFSTLNNENIKEIVKIEGLEYIEHAFQKGKGVIGLTAHLGNWELSGVVMALLGFPIHAVALNHENTKINRLFVNQRAMKGINVIPVGAKARRYLNVLKNNHLIALVGDRLTSEAGIETVFFNRKTEIPRGAAALSLRTGAPIVPGFMIRTPEDNFRLIFEKPIQSEEFKDGSNTAASGQRSNRFNIVEAEKKLTRHINSILEKYIAKYPSQWFLFYKVWP